MLLLYEIKCHILRAPVRTTIIACIAALLVCGMAFYQRNIQITQETLEDLAKQMPVQVCITNREGSSSSNLRIGTKGVWEKLLEILIDEPDYEWLMIDASHIKVHPQAAGAKGGNQDMTRTKGGSTPKYIWPWMRMVCQSECLLQKVPERIAKKLST